MNKNSLFKPFPLLVSSLILCMPLFSEGARKKESKGPPYQSIRLHFEIQKEELDIGGNPFITTNEKGIKMIDVNQAKKRIEKTIYRKTRVKETETKVVRLINAERTAILRPKEKVAYYFEQHQSTGPVWLEVEGDEEALVEEEEWLGKECKVYKTDEQTVWIWEGLVLKQEYKKGNITQSIQVTKIDENPKLDSRLFDIPPDFTILPILDIKKEEPDPKAKP